jgi:hypothetical protein
MTLSALRRWRQGLLAAAVSAALVAGLGACGAGRGALGTSSSPCFIALPVAKRAVQARGKLAGILLVDAASLTDRDERAVRKLLASLPVRRTHDVCLIAYAGSFTPGQVELAVPYAPSPARFAVAVVTTPRPRLLGTLLVRRVPKSFSHAHVDF